MSKLVSVAVATALVCSAPAAVHAQQATTASEPALPALVIAEPKAPADNPNALVLPKGTLVRLMVLVEVNTRQKKPGDRFALRVDEPIVVNGVTIVPAGATGWGEVTMVKENGVAGSSGKIAAKLSHIDFGDTKIPLDGEDQSKAAGSGNRVAMAVLSFGLLGLLTKGNDGKLKGGHIFNGYVAENMLFNPDTRSFLPPKVQAAQHAQ